MPSLREALTREERTQPREAVLDHESVPHYNSLTPKQRDRWNRYLAQRFMKPKSEVTKADYDQANSWKWPSLIWASLDAGLRPKEISRAKVSWVDVEKALLRISPDDAVKNSKRWKVGLRDRTGSILENWIEERERYEKYDDTELLWGNEVRKSLREPVVEPAIPRVVRRDRNRSVEPRPIVVFDPPLSGAGDGEGAGCRCCGCAASPQIDDSTLRYIRPSAAERQDVLDNMGYKTSDDLLP
jgi:integrase